jgi:hypothetical protein
LRLRLHASGARGLWVLALLLSVNGAIAVYSSLSGLTDAIAFVRKSDEKLIPISGLAGSILSVVPARQQFGYYAPQVCSEFRLLVHLGDSKSQKVHEVRFPMSSEAELLLSSLNSQAQDEAPAKAIAGAYASYSLDHDRSCDFALVYVQAEIIPPLNVAATQKPHWITVRGFFFKR